MYMVQMDKLHEGLLTQIAKAIATAMVKIDLPKDIDPEIKKSVALMQYYAADSERRLKKFCQDHPDNEKCKKGK